MKKSVTQRSPRFRINGATAPHWPQRIGSGVLPAAHVKNRVPIMSIEVTELVGSLRRPSHVTRGTCRGMPRTRPRSSASDQEKFYPRRGARAHVAIVTRDRVVLRADRADRARRTGA